ncbi:hypothetical protein SCLCIDRAFT_405614 [Scleroderma citrinum Foug A]|uniref:Uncharacterized protein n=1 Tax=Scleroderma citrinum Foug A TaxID=1036808 RepID=A0A0C3DD39_9AGAM|nr:hypothetical protein SCLCIDRAFT_405614 [Scleroderma citrinum Foug A]
MADGSAVAQSIDSFILTPNTNIVSAHAFAHAFLPCSCCWVQNRIRQHVAHCLLVERGFCFQVSSTALSCWKSSVLPKAIDTNRSVSLAKHHDDFQDLPRRDHLSTKYLHRLQRTRQRCLARNSDDHPFHHYSYLHRLRLGLRLLPHRSLRC